MVVFMYLSMCIVMLIVLFMYMHTYVYGYTFVYSYAWMYIHIYIYIYDSSLLRRNGEPFHQHTLSLFGSPSHVHRSQFSCSQSRLHRCQDACSFMMMDMEKTRFSELSDGSGLLNNAMMKIPIFRAERWHRVFFWQVQLSCLPLFCISSGILALFQPALTY